jgi:hypothetical protein
MTANGSTCCRSDVTSSDTQPAKLCASCTQGIAQRQESRHLEQGRNVQPSQRDQWVPLNNLDDKEENGYKSDKTILRMARHPYDVED